MYRILVRRILVIGVIFTSLTFSSNAQNFEISTDLSDTLSPTSYLIQVSGFATFTDSMVMEVSLMTADSLDSVVYSGYKDFSSGGLNTLTNFTYDSTSEAFSLDVGTYASLNYRVRILSTINGVLEEEIIIDTY